MEYTHIFFDLGLTLVHCDRERDYLKILKENGISRSFDEVRNAFHLADKTFFREYPGVLGVNPEFYVPWYYGILNYHLKVQLDLVDLAQEMMEFNNQRSWVAFPFTKPTLKKLKERGFKLGIISNWDKSCRDVIDSNGLDKYFDYVVISSELGVSKPGRSIFENALKIADVSARQCIYVGDNYYDDVKGCSKVAMECILINPRDRLGIGEIDYNNIIENISEVPDRVMAMMEEKNVR